MQTARNRFPTRKDWAKLIIDLQPDRFVTLCTNPTNALKAGLVHNLSDQQAVAYMDRLAHELDRRMNSRLFGRRYYKLPSEKRLQFVMAIEHCASNVHGHAFFKQLPSNARLKASFEAMLAQEWQAIVKGGTVDVRDMPSQEALENRAFYVTKEQGWHISDAVSEKILIYPKQVI